MHQLKPKILKPKGQRNGRGFSRGEIGKAGLNAAEATSLGLPVDLRRKTAHEENVEVVKAYVEKAKAEAKSKLKVGPKKKSKS